MKEDVELQAYINEVSLNGTGPNGGIGKVKVFIKKTKHKTQVSSKQVVDA